MLQHEVNRQKQHQESRERERIALMGGNPDEVMLRQQQKAQLEKDRQ